MGLVAALGGAASALPLLLVGAPAAAVGGAGGGALEAALSLGCAMGSCFLFGVTYRFDLQACR